MLFFARSLLPLVAAVVLVGSDSWATSAYNQAVLDDQPLFYWTFDEAANTANAVSQGSYSTSADELVASGGASRSSSTTTPGGVSLGRAAALDGATATRYMASDLSGSTIGNSWAVEFWMKFDQDPKTVSIYSYFMHASYDLVWNTPTVFRYPDHVVRVLDQYTDGVSGGPIIDDTAWHHVVVGTLNSSNGSPGSHQTFVLDGVASHYSGTAFANAFTLQKLAVGNTLLYSGASWIGKMDEFAIYDLAISPGQADGLNHFQSRVVDLSSHRLVPEPSTALLLPLGLAALGARHRTAFNSHREGLSR